MGAELPAVAALLAAGSARPSTPWAGFGEFGSSQGYTQRFISFISFPSFVCEGFFFPLFHKNKNLGVHRQTAIPGV